MSANYSGLKDIDMMPYRMIEKLIEEADENFWKLLKYDDNKALFHKELTEEEKSNLIWIDQDQNSCRIFFSRIIEDNIPAEHAIIKLYNGKMTPLNAYTVNIQWFWEILWGANQSIVYNMQGYPVNRGDLIMHYIFQCLNGEYVGGVGDVSFIADRGRNAYGQSVIGNTTNYTGYILSMPTAVGKKETCCE